jgi:hypothetical protein
MDTFHSVAKPAGFIIDSNGFEPDFIFTSLFHDRLLLLIDFRRSVGDSSKCSRCPYGNPLNIKGLAARYGLPWALSPLPRAGEGDLYRRSQSSNPLVIILIGAYFILVVLALALFRPP